MSDEESLSESEFYYLKDEEQAKSEKNNVSKVITHEDENFGNSQEELQNFVQEQKSENSVKETSSDMKCFYHFLGEINKTNVPARVSFPYKAVVSIYKCKYGIVFISLFLIWYGLCSHKIILMTNRYYQ